MSQDTQTQSQHTYNIVTARDMKTITVATGRAAADLGTSCSCGVVGVDEGGFADKDVDEEVVVDEDEVEDDEAT